jgi:hypothetical protein
MTRRMLLWVPFAAAGLRAGLRDDDSDDIRALLNAAAGALRERSEEHFLAVFDPAMKSYRELRANIHQLLRDADVEANIGIAPTELNWSLEITAHDLAAGVTHRKGKAAYTTRRIGGNLRIASFEPVALFAPPYPGWRRICNWLRAPRTDGRKTIFRTYSADSTRPWRITPKWQ